MTSKSKKSAKKPIKIPAPKKAIPTGRQAVTKRKTAVKKSSTKTKKLVPNKIAPTAKKVVAKKQILKKKTMPTRLRKASAEQGRQANRQAVVKKSTPVKKPTATKKATPKKSIKKNKVGTEVEKVVNPTNKQITQPKLGDNDNGKLVELVASNDPSTEEKSNVEDNIITDLPVPDKNTQQGKFARNFDKHQIQISSVKKGGLKPSGKKPLW